MTSLSTPKDAAAVILLRQTPNQQIQRSSGLSGVHLAFAWGFLCLPGGQIDDDDGVVQVANVTDQQPASMISGAARELFEELGVLVVQVATL